jgi:sirohydrochlorin ferrochelatase
MKQALLLVAHGSRLNASNAEVQSVTDQLRLHYSALFSVFETAFLELTTPSIEQGISSCIAQGAQHIRVLPYFLAVGRHVTEDIPRIIEQSRLLYPNVAIELAPHLGASALIEEALMVVAVDEGDAQPLTRAYPLARIWGSA